MQAKSKTASQTRLQKSAKDVQYTGFMLIAKAASTALSGST